MILASCGNIDKKTIPDDELKENQYIGEWQTIEGKYIFEAALKIDSNHNFTYEGGACLLHFSSEGSWIIIDDTLIINSFDCEECRYLSKFSEIGEIVVIIENETSIKISHPKSTSIEDCEPAYPDEEYVIFNQEKFLIKDSVLTYIQKTDNSCRINDEKNNFIRKQK